ncbi:MAG: succinate dehydrogenase cytochrome b subunit [Candidatus Marinimicrobia bacterium]|nr:succinate dehydrogenase cytochrome b subunit [Candidatus Neomarinimicrobiota bacterium]
MTWIFTFFQSSIGKKILMATTGILLSLFLATHLLGNLMLFGGAEMFNNYVHSLANMKPVVRFAEVILTLLFLAHIISGIRVTLENKRAKSISYKISPGPETTKLHSRSMAISGSIVFIFLVFHLQTFWYSFQNMHSADADFYDVVINSKVGYNNPLIAGFYILALLLLALHLRHGFQSAFQTFGVGDSRYKSLIETVAVFFWLVIPLGFISIPVYFGFIK